MKMRVAALLIGLSLLAVTAHASGHHHKKKHSAATTTPTGQQFYVLAMSWAPNYCDDPSKPKSSSECGHHYGFIVHGLWLTNADGTQPDLCQGGPPIGQAAVNALMPYIPDSGLIAHEWKAHWSCHGTPQDFVDAVKHAVALVQVPDAYKQPIQDVQVGTKKMEQDFAQKNGAPAEDFRISCHAGKLINFESCMTMDYKLQSCGRLRECPAPQVGLDAVR
jgi:ribonuclease T2